MSDRYLVFYLDGMEVQNPIGWDKMRIIVERDLTMRGLLTSYIDKLTFIGDGYTYLMSYIDIGDPSGRGENGFCHLVDFEVIEYENGSVLTGGFNYKGVIDLSDSKINRAKCRIDVSIQDESFAWMIKKHRSVEVRINQQPTTLDGGIITPVGDEVAGALLGDVSGIFGVIHYYPNLTNSRLSTVKLSDAFQYLLDYITNNAITLQSNLLTVDEFTPYMTTLTFGALAGGQTSSVTYKNVYNQTVSWSATGPLSATAHATEFVVDNIYSRQSEGVNTNDFSKLASIKLETGSTVAFRILGFWDYDFTVDGVHVTQSSTTQFVDGAANISYTTPWNILNDAANITGQKGHFGVFSFDTLIKELGILFDAEFTVKNINNVPTCIVEPRSYFFNQSTSITITDVSEIQESIADDFIFKSLDYKQPSSDEPLRVLQTATYTIDNCGINSYNAALNFYYGYHANSQITQLDDNCVLPFRITNVLGIGDIPTGTALAEYSLANGTLGGVTNYPFLVSEFAAHPLIMKRHSVFSKYNPMGEGNIFDNQNDININRMNVFNYSLCWSDMKTIIENPEKSIDFYYTQTDKRTGYIRRIEYDVLTGKTKFELYSN